MLDFSTVYENASKREQKVLDKIDGNTLDSTNMIAQLSSTKFTSKEITILQDIVDLYVSLEQNTGFIEVLGKALNMAKRKAFIIEKVLAEAKYTNKKN